MFTIRFLIAHVRWGCVMLLCLFNVLMDRFIKRACEGITFVMVGDTNVKMLMYVDDAALVA